MDTRLRVGLIAGSGVAISTLLLALTLNWFCGPFLAILGGLSAGMQIARDPQYAGRAPYAAAFAGMYAGLMTAAAQVIGMLLSLTTPGGHDAQTLFTTRGPYSSNLFVLVSVLFAIMLAVLDVGIMAGAAALIAHRLTRVSSAVAGIQPTSYAPHPTTPYPIAYTPPPVTYAPPPAPIPPPASYPPPPSYYGAKDLSPTAVPESPPIER